MNRFSCLVFLAACLLAAGCSAPGVPSDAGASADAAQATADASAPDAEAPSPADTGAPPDAGVSGVDAHVPGDAAGPMAGDAGAAPDAGLGVIHPAASCQAADVNAALALAGPGDTVTVPAGTCTWSTAEPVRILKAVTLQGAGVDVTHVTIGAGADYGGVLFLSADGATVQGFTFENTTGSYPLYADTTGFRITGNKFVGAGYGIEVIHAWGLIDANTFAQTSGEFIQTIGPCDSWQTPDSFGTADNVFIENNHLAGGGYITCNADARCVFRFNTITGSQFFEAHQKCTNTNYCPGGETHRGPRQSEVYGNLWSTSENYFDWTDIYGGTARIFDNRILVSAYLWLSLTEYSAQWTSGCWDYAKCNCTWPALDQVGVGMDPIVGGSDPVYIWNNQMGPDVDHLAPVQVTVGSGEPCAVDGQCGAGFSMSTLIAEGRDYFVSATQPAAIAGYRPFACPHPRTGLKGTCDSSKPGQAGYLKP
ncbi:MAG: hypothetical protein QM765_35715 [Myxococcales bacterium]